MNTKAPPVLVNGSPVKYRKLKQRSLANGLHRYIENAVPPGSFLLAVLRNDLRAAVAVADSMSLIALPDLVRWLYNDAPRGCSGSPEIVKAYIKQRAAVLCPDPSTEPSP